MCFIGIRAGHRSLMSSSSLADGAARLSFPWLGWAEISITGEPDYLVKGILSKNCLSTIYGEPKSGKSFFAIDVALHVALGWPSRGRKVSRGLVIYIAAEGATSVKKRIEAFRQVHGINSENVRFVLLPCPVDLRNPQGDTDGLIGDIGRISTDLESPVALVVVDTLSRCLAGGNDNAPDDMGSLINHCDKIRRETGAHVCIVHHSPKANKMDMRGSTHLAGAVDTAICVEKLRTGLAKATVMSQRDLPEGDEFFFRLRPVELGLDDEDDPITSCVVEPEDEGPSNKPQLSNQQVRALELLMNALVDAGEVPPANNHIPANVKCVPIDLWRRYCRQGNITTSDKPDAFKKACLRAFEGLLRKGLIGTWDRWIWLA